MVRCCRTPAIARELFSANQLSGWVSGIQYTPRQLKRRRVARLRRLQAAEDVPSPPALRLNIGVRIS